VGGGKKCVEEAYSIIEKKGQGEGGEIIPKKDRGGGGGGLLKKEG